MNRAQFIILGLLALAAPRALADIDVGSDGSDGALDLTGQSGTVTIDLSLAADATWDTPSPVAGNGVYDADQWAVVFKYTSITIPSGVTVAFTNHPSRAPVVWLSQGGVTIAGTVSLDGQTASGITFPEPGPGGFRGGRTGAGSTPATGGMGPGAGAVSSSGSYAEAGNLGDSGMVYGNPGVLPLIGGSGGGRQNGFTSSGAGAILIASNTSLVVSGGIRARGTGSSSSSTAPGSGGAIRLLADSVQVSGASASLTATGGSAGISGNRGGHGRIRIESNSLNFGIVSNPPTSFGIPGFVFPPATAPRIRAVNINGVSVPTDPRSQTEFVEDVDVVLDTCDTVTLNIEAENVPLATTVGIRVVPINDPDGNIQPLLFESGPLTGTFALSTAMADVTFPKGYSIVQLRADFGSNGARQGQLGVLPKDHRALRTANNELVTGIESSGSKTNYITETGRRIPADSQ